MKIKLILLLTIIAKNIVSADSSGNGLIPIHCRFFNVSSSGLIVINNKEVDNQVQYQAKQAYEQLLSSQQIWTFSDTQAIELLILENNQKLDLVNAKSNRGSMHDHIFLIK